VGERGGECEGCAEGRVQKECLNCGEKPGCAVEEEVLRGGKRGRGKELFGGNGGGEKHRGPSDERGKLEVREEGEKRENSVGLFAAREGEAVKESSLMRSGGRRVGGANEGKVLQQRGQGARAENGQWTNDSSWTWGGLPRGFKEDFVSSKKARTDKKERRTRLGWPWRGTFG